MLTVKDFRNGCCSGRRLYFDEIFFSLECSHAKLNSEEWLSKPQQFINLGWFHVPKREFIQST